MWAVDFCQSLVWADDWKECNSTKSRNNIGNPGTPILEGPRTFWTFHPFHSRFQPIGAPLQVCREDPHGACPGNPADLLACWRKASTSRLSFSWMSESKEDERLTGPSLILTATKASENWCLEDDPFFFGGGTHIFRGELAVSCMMFTRFFHRFHQALGCNYWCHRVCPYVFLPIKKHLLEHSRPGC